MSRWYSFLLCPCIFCVRFGSSACVQLKYKLYFRVLILSSRETTLLLVWIPYISFDTQIPETNLLFFLHSLNIYMHAFALFNLLFRVFSTFVHWVA